MSFVCSHAPLSLCHPVSCLPFFVLVTLFHWVVRLSAFRRGRTVQNSLRQCFPDNNVSVFSSNLTKKKFCQFFHKTCTKNTQFCDITNSTFIMLATPHHHHHHQCFCCVPDLKIKFELACFYIHPHSTVTLQGRIV